MNELARIFFLQHMNNISVVMKDGSFTGYFFSIVMPFLLHFCLPKNSRFLLLGTPGIVASYAFYACRLVWQLRYLLLDGNVLVDFL